MDLLILIEDDQLFYNDSNFYVILTVMCVYFGDHS